MLDDEEEQFLGTAFWCKSREAGIRTDTGRIGTCIKLLGLTRVALLAATTLLACLKMSSQDEEEDMEDLGPADLGGPTDDAA